ncbi:hypothetical protein FRC18_008269 [Serendipita sp. 400]|nr:hypothetical protein FRC18_008269 [Serendipita sp. 400]
MVDTAVVARVLVQRERRVTKRIVIVETDMDLRQVIINMEQQHHHRRHMGMGMEGTRIERRESGEGVMASRVSPRLAILRLRGTMDLLNMRL